MITKEDIQNLRGSKNNAKKKSPDLTHLETFALKKFFA